MNKYKKKRNISQVSRRPSCPISGYRVYWPASKDRSYCLGHAASRDNTVTRQLVLNPITEP